MVLDDVTLLVVSGLVVVLCGLSFILNTAYSHDDPPGRVWSIAFMAGVLSSLAYAVYALNASAWSALIVANAAFAVAAGALWSGARLYNRRSSLFWVTGVAFVVVALAVVLRGPGAGGWAGAVELYLAVAAFAALGAAEAYRGRLRRNVNGRLLVVIFILVAMYYAARAIVFLVDGPEGTLFREFFDTAITTIVNVMLVVIASIAMSVLRAERGRGRAVGDVSRGINSAAGVLSAAAFAQAAADHVDRARHAGQGMAMIGADMDNLVEFNTAFGRADADEAIGAFAQTLRMNAPVMAIIGHPGAGRFLVLTPVASVTEATVIAERLQLALVDQPLTSSRQIRITASFGLTDSWNAGHDLDALTRSVGAAIDAVKLAGGNDIRVVSS
jgi:diguanylate cyclase (GGDEF)-like protein